MIPQNQLDDIKTFLIKARSHTYATDQNKVTPLVPHATQMEYQEGDWFYRDMYDGEVRFQGREVIYHKGKPVWGMVYEGGIEKVLKGMQSENLYAFHKKVLSKFVTTVRILGEVTYAEKDFTFRGKTKNQKDVIGKFWGEESITYKGKIVYQLAYGGGWIH